MLIFVRKLIYMFDDEIDFLLMNHFKKSKNVTILTEELQYFFMSEWAFLIYCKIPITCDGLIYRLLPYCNNDGLRTVTNFVRISNVCQLDGAYNPFNHKCKIIDIGKDINNPVFKINWFKLKIKQHSVYDFSKHYNLLN